MEMEPPGPAMMLRRALVTGLLWLCPAYAADAQDIPPRDVLNAIVSQITSKPVPTAITFDKGSRPTDGVCRLLHARMNLTRNGSTVRNFSVLVDHAEGNESPKVFFVTLSRVAVDADGSGRGQHQCGSTCRQP